MRFHCIRSERTEPVPSGLKAHATLAWSKPGSRAGVLCPLGWNAPGHRRLTLSGLKARAKCLIRNSQLHESKSFSIEDIFLSPFSAQKKYLTH